MADRAVDVVVVGGGLSGLAAAHRLTQAGREVVVLEAKEAAGGHAFAVERPSGGTFEKGGEFVGRAQRRVVGLAAELGIGITDIPAGDGDGVRIFAGERMLEPVPMGADPAGRAAYLAAIARIDELAATLPYGRPWDAPDAPALDELTLAAWTAANVPHPGAKALLDLELALGLSGAAWDVSFLQVLSSVRAAGGCEPLWAEVSAVLDGGSSGLCGALAERLGPRVVTGAPVRAIEHGRDGVAVHGDFGTVRARAAILAIGPVLCGQIDFAPMLPLRRRLLQRRWSQAPAFKLFAVYDRPWWRERGLSGSATGDTSLATQLVFDASPPDASEGILVGFSNVTRALPEAMLAGPAARRAAFAESLVAYFGAEAAALTEYAEGDWSDDRWVSGCGSCPGPGVLTGFGPALREPVGPLLWAGTETAEEWHSFLEGAVCAADRAVAEALELPG